MTENKIINFNRKIILRFNLNFLLLKIYHGAIRQPLFLSLSVARLSIIIS